MDFVDNGENDEEYESVHKVSLDVMIKDTSQIFRWIKLFYWLW